MHPMWQPKQTVFVDGEGHVDRANPFGSCASGALFISVNSLVSWIAKNVAGIKGCTTYVDDTSGIEFADETTFYKPYQKDMPSKQVSLLCLWDELGIPHKEKKQVSGAPLTVIGIDVDPNEMTLSLSPEAQSDLIHELRLWSSKPTRRSNGCFKLRRWQTLAGWVNWALNVYPLLRPCLNNVYPKMHGSPSPHQNIWVNNAVWNDLQWAANHVENSTGVHLLKSRCWSAEDADVTIYCDACMDRMGYWFPDHKVSYFSPVPFSVPSDIIFYFEALCVAAALEHAHLSTADGARILIYTNNMNTVDIFNSLRCKPEYNPILCFAVDILIDSNHD